MATRSIQWAAGLLVLVGIITLLWGFAMTEDARHTLDFCEGLQEGTEEHPGPTGAECDVAGDQEQQAGGLIIVGLVLSSLAFVAVAAEW